MAGFIGPCASPRALWFNGQGLAHVFLAMPFDSRLLLPDSSPVSVSVFGGFRVGS